MPKLKPSRNPFVRDWGHLPARKKGAIRKVLSSFMNKVNAMTERDNARRLQKHFPEQCTTCSSCGLSPTAHPNKGFLPTTYGLLYTLVHDKYFVCHANQPEWKETGVIDTERLRLCGNSVTIKTLYKEELAFLAKRTMNAIQQIMQRPAR